MKGRLADNFAVPMTIVNPPPVQEMKSENDEEGTTSSSNMRNGQTNLEMQAL